MFSVINKRLKQIITAMKKLGLVPMIIFKSGLMLSTALATSSILMMFYGNHIVFILPGLTDVAKYGLEISVQVLSQTTIGALLIQFFFFRNK